MTRNRTFVFDLDGVVYLGGDGIPGAGETLRTLAARGDQILFATNNSSRALSTVVGHIAERTGFEPDPRSVITSGMAAARLIGDDETCIVLGSTELEETLAARDIAITTDPYAANTLVVGLDRRLSYERLTAAVLAVNNGARFIATNDDVTFPTPEGQHPGAGAIAAAVERATGVSALVCGKPHAPMRLLIEERIVHDEVWMVGDRPDTDLAFAAAAGWGKILVLTGVVDSADGLPEHLAPDHTLRSIAELVDLADLETRQSPAVRR